MDDWIFDAPVEANGTKLVVEVPDGALTLHLYQLASVTPVVSDTDVANLLRFAVFPRRNQSLTDFHYGDAGEMVALAALIMRDIDTYCFGGVPLSLSLSLSLAPPPAPPRAHPCARTHTHARTHAHTHAHTHTHTHTQTHAHTHTHRREHGLE